MRSRLGIALLALALTATALPASAAHARGCGRAASEVPMGGTVGGGTVGVARRATLCLINQARARRRLRPLRADAALAARAQHHANDMIGGLYFSQAHNRQAVTWNVDIYAAPKYAVQRMLARHRSLLLGRGARRAGVGVAPATPFSPDRRGATYVVDVG